MTTSWMMGLLTGTLLCALLLAAWKVWGDHPLRHLEAARQAAGFVLARPGRAERFLRGRVRDDPGNHDAVLLHAAALLELGRNGELVESYRARARDPNVGYGLSLLLAKASLRMRDPTAARGFLRQTSKDSLLLLEVQDDEELRHLLDGVPGDAAGKAPAGYN